MKQKRIVCRSMFMILLFAPATQYYICATKQQSMIVAAHYTIGYMLCLMGTIEANARNIWIKFVYLCGPYTKLINISVEFDVYFHLELLLAIQLLTFSSVSAFMRSVVPYIRAHRHLSLWTFHFLLPHIVNVLTIETNFIYSIFRKEKFERKLCVHNNWWKYIRKEKDIALHCIECAVLSWRAK